jgi:FdhD protein
MTGGPLALDAGLPWLSQARSPMTCDIEAQDETGQRRKLAIPVERGLTIYVDKRELITLMTLGARPEWLVLGYLRNQGLIASAQELDSITVDWEVGAAAVKTRGGIAAFEKRTAHRVVTTGCGQGSVFGGLMDQVQGLRLPLEARISPAQIHSLVDTIRLTESTYKSAGSVHACALFDLSGQRPEMLLFIEDVGRHNAVDTIAGWAWLQRPPAQLALYTTGRLTSEMVIKAAQMGIPFVISRSGITQMGHQVAQTVGLCAIGRALHQRYLCFSHPQRLLQPAPPLRTQS